MEGAEGEQFGVLALHSGDTVKIEIDETDWAGGQILDSLPTIEDRAAYLEDKGYSPSIARLLAENLDDLTNIRREFYVKSVQISLSLTPDGGSFACEISYCNKIEKGGETWIKGGHDINPAEHVVMVLDLDPPPPPDLPPFK